MADTILILGNGFDLAQERRTSYTDFLEFLNVVSSFLFFYNQEKRIEKNSLRKHDIGGNIDFLDKVVGRMREALKNQDDVHGRKEKLEKYIINEFEDKSYLFLLCFFNKELQDYIRDRDRNRYVSLRQHLSSTLTRYYEISEIVQQRKLSRRSNRNEGDRFSLFKNRNTIRWTFKQSFRPDRIIEENKDIYDELIRFLDKLDKAQSCPEYDLSIITSLYTSKKKLQISIQDNFIFNFISENKFELGKNWASLELIISDLANTINDIKQHIRDYETYLNPNASELIQAIESLKSYENNHNQYVSDIISAIRDIDYNSSTSISNFSHKSNPMAYVYIIDSIRKTNGDDKPLQSVIDELNEKLIKDLDELTDWLEFYLTYLNHLDKGKEKVSGTVLDIIVNIENSNVINFNYTDTITRFGVEEENIHFIHGRLNFYRSRFPINQMVFGIEDKESELEDISSDLIPYQKFYQRVVKETGNDFEKFFEGTKDSWKGSSVFGSEPENPKNIVIYGHSVDPLDKEIFQKCFELAKEGKYDYRFIFVYYNEQDKRSIAKNLAIILGKREFIRLSAEKRVAFVKWDDVKKMEILLLP